MAGSITVPPPARAPAGIQLATAADHPALAALLAELLPYYALPARALEMIERDLAALPAGIEFLLALDADRVRGFASFAVLFPTDGTGTQLFLKDLYIAEDARRRGLGRALLRGLAGIARIRGCVRVDWSTDRSNEAALALYASIGAQILPEKVHLRMGPAAIEALAHTS